MNGINKISVIFRDDYQRWKTCAGFKAHSNET